MVIFMSQLFMILQKKMNIITLENLAIRYASRAEFSSSGAQWSEEDDILDPYQSKQTRIQDAVEQSLAKQFYVDDNVVSADTEKGALDLLK